uniref:ATP synthase F0 subunit 8 n=1 Tax=Olinga feredayi TaxID=177813 RepID=UPI0028D2189C|nr:ATP synthase F0 subunit 8 [Olinga feredayi]WMQ76541.1 ATP synthase F0 subunit 8 [Olinga feredayi]
MPQMMPLNWMLLNIIFIMMFMISMMMIFYIYKINSSNNNLQLKILKNKMIWKW